MNIHCRHPALLLVMCGFAGTATAEEPGQPRRQLTPPPELTFPAPQPSVATLAAQANIHFIKALDLRDQAIGAAVPMTGLNFYRGRARATDAMRYRAQLTLAIDAVASALDSGATSKELGTAREGVMHLTRTGLPHKVKVAVFDADVQTLEDDEAMRRLDALRNRLH